MVHYASALIPQAAGAHRSGWQYTGSANSNIDDSPINCLCEDSEPAIDIFEQTIVMQARLEGPALDAVKEAIRAKVAEKAQNA